MRARPVRPGPIWWWWVMPLKKILLLSHPSQKLSIPLLYEDHRYILIGQKGERTATCDQIVRTGCGHLSPAQTQIHHAGACILDRSNSRAFSQPHRDPFAPQAGDKI